MQISIENQSIRSGVSYIAAAGVLCGLAKYNGLSNSSLKVQAGAFTVAALAQSTITYCSRGDTPIKKVVSFVSPFLVAGIATRFCKFKHLALSSAAAGVLYLGTKAFLTPKKSGKGGVVEGDIIDENNPVVAAIQNLEKRLASIQNKNTSYAQSGMGLFFLIGMLLRAMPESHVGPFIENLGLKGMSEKEIHQELFKIQRTLNESINPEIAVANAVISDCLLEDAFNKDIKEFYGAECLPPDKDQINLWVSNKTKGLIPQLFEEFPRDGGALINTLFFKGKWDSAFEERDTQTDVFMTIRGEEVRAQIMKQQGVFEYYKGPDFAVLEKPYIVSGGEPFTFTIFLPDEGRNINDLEKQLTPQFIANCRDKKRMQGNIKLLLPKIDIEAENRDLINGLEQLGFCLPTFLSRFNVAQRLKEIGQVCHIKSDEKGTEAAAVSYAMTKCMPEKPLSEIVFDARRPFIAMINRGKQSYFQMAIKDKTGLVE